MLYPTELRAHNRDFNEPSAANVAFTSATASLRSDYHLPSSYALDSTARPLSNGDVMRLGLYGGSFDPVHLGHLLVAQAAREELALDRLCFIPAAHSPFKRETKLTPAATREQLLRLALAGDPHADVDEQELQRGGVSFTIETVRDYRRRFPQVELFWLIGADHVATLPEWHEADELARHVEFVVISRPGEPTAAVSPPFHGRMLRGFPLGVSSSQIRARVKAGLGIRHLVPEAVAEAISHNGLYL